MEKITTEGIDKLVEEAMNKDNLVKRTNDFIAAKNEDIKRKQKRGMLSNQRKRIRKVRKKLKQFLKRGIKNGTIEKRISEEYQDGDES